MEIIAHRGLCYGNDYTLENVPKTIDYAIENNFSVELDIWLGEDDYYLGHDGPTYKVKIPQIIEWANKQPVYLHCKTIATLQDIHSLWDIRMHPRIIPFFHDSDECVILNENLIWIHPKSYYKSLHIPSNSILVMPALNNFEYYDKDQILKFHGVCTDYPVSLRNALNDK